MADRLKANQTVSRENAQWLYLKNDHDTSREWISSKHYFKPGCQ